MIKPIACLRPLPPARKTATPAASRSLWSTRSSAPDRRSALCGRLFWRSKLAGVPLLLDLPEITPSGRRTDLPSASTAFALPAELSERLRLFARSEMTQVFSVLLAAWQILLFRHSGQGAFLVGCAAPGGGTSLPDRPMVLPASVERATSFREAIRAVSMHRAASSTTSADSLDEILSALGVALPAYRHPLFQTAFIERHALGSRISPAVQPGRHAPCDLALVWEDAGPCIRGRLEYPAGVLDPAAANQLVAHLHNLLRAALVLPNAPVSALPIHDLAEYGAASA